jgi:hypothetical protein
MLPPDAAPPGPASRCMNRSHRSSIDPASIAASIATQPETPVLNKHVPEPFDPSASRAPRRFAWEAGALAWLAAVALLIWFHARVSTQPPIYDAFTYYYKAKLVWGEVLHHHLGWRHLLNIEPSFRPPGTTLMSYPFGFDADFRGFYFRSVFFPVALVFASVFVAAWRPESSTRSQRLTALTAVFLSTLSMFFYFEPYAGGPPAISHWGLVDSYLTGLAALTMAAGVRSIVGKSWHWAVVSTLLAILDIFTKPSGVLIAAASGVVIAIGWLWNLYRAWPLIDGRRVALRRTAGLFAFQAAFLGAAVLAATHSNYLGPANMNYGNAAIQVMRAEMVLPFGVLMGIVHGGLGPFIPIWASAVAILWVLQRWWSRRTVVEGRETDDLLAILSAATLLLGIWFWLIESGAETQIRYFTPFLYVAFACAVAPSIRMLSRCAAVARWCVCAVMLAGTVNMTLLLALPDPSLAWQLASGVNVKSGTRAAGVRQAEAILAATPPDSSTILIYSFVQGITDAMFDSVFAMQSLKAPLPRIGVRRPVDWQRPSTFRVDEILTATYILFDPSAAQATLPERVDDYATEQTVFDTWAKNLTAADGVERISSEPDSVLLRITDRAALRHSLEALIASHRWRELFLAENVAKWWSEAQVEKALAETPAAVANVSFEDKFVLRAISFTRLSDGGVEMNIWLRSDLDAHDGDWNMLIHTLNARNVAISNRDMALGTPEAAPEDRPFWYFHQKFTPPRGATRVAIGMYRGQTMLSADRGERDNGGTRLLVDLPASAP